MNPAAAEGDVLTRQLSRAIHVVAAAKPATPALLRSTYEGLTSLFDRIRKQDRPSPDSTSEATVQDVKTLLFGPVVSIESLRALRADAVTSMVKACPSMDSVVEADVKALIASEVSSSVRDRFRTS